MKNKKTITTDWNKIIIKRNPKFNWTENEKGVVIEITRDTFIDKICQKWFKTPRSSFVQMDELGSFFWRASDGTLTVAQIAQKMEEELKEKAKDSLARATKFALQLSKARLAHFLIKEESK